MKANVIYLQSGFWKQLQMDTSIAGLRCVLNVYEAISEANLRTDIEDEIWDSDPFLKMLWKRYTEGQSDIELFEKILADKPELTAEGLSAIYLTELDGKKCEQLAISYGIAAINSVDMPRKEYLFKGDGFMLKKSDTYDNRYLQFKSKIHYPCNSMILIDPYLLSKRENIENNLYYLLEVILPEKRLDVPFQIAIFSMLGAKNNDAYDAKKGEAYYNDISNLIKAINKKLDFSLALYAIGASEEFHSRIIITNNIIFDAPDGFEVYNDNGQSTKNALFNIVFPRLVGDNRQDMSNYLRWIKIAKKRSVKQMDSQFWGVRDNRLFDLV